MSRTARIVTGGGTLAPRRWDLPALPRAAPGRDGFATPPRPSAPAPDNPPTPAETTAALAAAREQGRQEGLSQGLAEKRKQAATELRDRLQTLDQMCTALARPLRAVDAEVERNLARLATLIAERVVGAELTLQPQRIVNVVRATLAALSAQAKDVEVAVSPAAARWLRESFGDTAHAGWSLREDAQLGPGDCRVHAGDSSIDGTTAARLKALVDVVLGESE
ncbi:MAG TPA: FliH/SctL family protein [Rhodanobacteraceae bacterium]|nr:FliH/SctL family protein [Rhodanobacteraceae bacterium]